MTLADSCAIVHIRRNSDGKIVKCDYGFTQPPDEPNGVELMIYTWLEGGHNSCDCKRQEFFNRVSGDQDDPSVTCDTDRYSVVKIELPNKHQIVCEK